MPALLGFVGFFVIAWWLYPVGAALTAIGFAYAAPSVRHLAEDQDELVAQGSSLSLVGALRRPPGAPGPDSHAA